MNFHKEVHSIFHLLLTIPSYQTVTSFSVVTCSPSGQTQAAKRTAQTDVTQYMNEKLLKIMCKIELYS